MGSYNESAVKQRYGRIPKSEEQILKHLKALKVIIGADGEIAKEEMKALQKGMKLMGATDAVKAAVDAFDHESAKLKDLVPDMKPGGTRAKILIRDAVEISGADGHYAKEEKAAVAKMAKLLGVDKQTLKSIEALVDLEKAVKNLRKGLFSKK